MDASTRVAAALDSSSEDEASKTPSKKTFSRTKTPPGFPWGRPWPAGSLSEQSQTGDRDSYTIQPEEMDQMKWACAEKERIIEQQTSVIETQSQQLQALQQDVKERDDSLKALLKEAAPSEQSQMRHRDHRDVEPEETDQIKSAAAEKERLIKQQFEVIEKQNQQLQTLQQDVKGRDKALKALLSNSADNSGVKLLQDENTKLKELLAKELEKSLQLQKEALTLGTLVETSLEKSRLKEMPQDGALKGRMAELEQMLRDLREHISAKDQEMDVLPRPSRGEIAQQSAAAGTNSESSI